MIRRFIVALASVVCIATPARAQDPFNLHEGTSSLVGTRILLLSGFPAQA